MPTAGVGLNDPTLRVGENGGKVTQGGPGLRADPGLTDGIPSGFLREGGTGVFLQRLHAVTLPIWRGFAPAPLFPRATASATVPTSRESAERRREFSFWIRRRRHLHDTPRRFQWRTLAKSGKGRMSGTPQRVAPTCASLGRGLSKPGFAGLADNPMLLCFKKCMNFFPSIQLPGTATGKG